MIVLRSLVVLTLCACCASLAGAGSPASKPATPSYLITNDDRPPKTATSSTVFTLANDGTLHNATRVSLGGGGAAGGYFASKRVSVLSSGSAACAFLSLGASGDISVVDLQSLRDIGNYPASSTDSGIDNGLRLAQDPLQVLLAAEEPSGKRVEHLFEARMFVEKLLIFEIHLLHRRSLVVRRS